MSSTIHRRGSAGVGHDPSEPNAHHAHSHSYHSRSPYATTPTGGFLSKSLHSATAHAHEHGSAGAGGAGGTANKSGRRAVRGSGSGFQNNNNHSSSARLAAVSASSSFADLFAPPLVDNQVAADAISNNSSVQRRQSDADFSPLVFAFDDLNVLSPPQATHHNFDLHAPVQPQPRQLSNLSALMGMGLFDVQQHMQKIPVHFNLEDDMSLYLNVDQDLSDNVTGMDYTANNDVNNNLILSTNSSASSIDTRFLFPSAVYGSSATTAPHVGLLLPASSNLINPAFGSSFTFNDNSLLTVNPTLTTTYSASAPNPARIPLIDEECDLDPNHGPSSLSSSVFSTLLMEAMERNEERSASPPLDFGEERCDSGQEVVAPVGPVTKAYPGWSASLHTGIQFEMDGIGDVKDDLDGEEEEEDYEEDSDDIMDPGIPQTGRRWENGIKFERGLPTVVCPEVDDADLDFDSNAIGRGNNVSAAAPADVSRSLPMEIVRTISIDKEERIHSSLQQMEQKPILLRLPSPNSLIRTSSASAVIASSSNSSIAIKKELVPSPTRRPIPLQQPIVPQTTGAANKLQLHSSPTSSGSTTNLSSEYETDWAAAADEDEVESLFESSPPETPVADEEWVPGGVPVAAPTAVSNPIELSSAASGGRRGGRRLGNSPAAVEGTLHQGKPSTSHPAVSSYGSGGSGTGLSGGRSRDYQCAECMKWFLRRQDLRRHEVTHSKVKAFACPHGCGTTFGRSDALSRHLKARRCMPGA